MKDSMQLSLDLYYADEETVRMLIREYRQSMMWRDYVGRD